MAKYVGQEHTMYLKICTKYKVQPEPEIKADGGPCCEMCILIEE
jgi:hypothetical protein